MSRWTTVASASGSIRPLSYGTPFINIPSRFSNKANIFSLVADFVF
jgi:hypothetical protein